MTKEKAWEDYKKTHKSIIVRRNIYRIEKMEIFDAGYNSGADARAEIAAKEIAELKKALIWCSGADDFQDSGKARKGWLEICIPLLEEKL